MKLNFLKKGYTDEDGIIREELITSEAQKIGKGLKRLSTSQLRAFFNEVKALDSKMKTVKEFKMNYPLILVLKSKTAYKFKNGRGDITESFKDFIDINVDAIQKAKKNSNEEGYKAFKNFVLLFETVVGYYYGFNA